MLLVLLPTLSLQLICQQLVCVTMVVLIAFLQPYKVAAYNYIDILFFTNLVFISTLNEYMLQASNRFNHLVTTNAVSVVLSILTSLPLVYIVGYIIWHFLVQPRKVQIASTLTLLMQKYLGMKKREENGTVINVTSQDIEINERKYVDVVIAATDDDDVTDARMREQITSSPMNTDITILNTTPN